MDTHTRLVALGHRRGDCCALRRVDVVLGVHRFFMGTTFLIFDFVTLIPIRYVDDGV